MNNSYSSSQTASRLSFVNDRWKFFPLFLLIFFLAVVGLQYVTMDNETRENFNDNHPGLLALENIEQEYTKIDTLIISLNNIQGDIYNSDYLQLVKTLNQDFQQVPYVGRIDSLANFQRIKLDGQDLIVDHLLNDELRLSDQQVLSDLKNYISNNIQLKNRIISSSNQDSAFVLTMNFPDKREKAVPESVEKVREILQSRIQEDSLFEYHLSGSAMAEVALTEAALVDVMTIIPLVYLTMFCFVGFLLRSARYLFGVWLTAVSSIMMTLGIVGWIGIALTPWSIGVPLVITTVVIAHSVHLLTTFKAYNATLLPIEALNKAYSDNLKPIFFTTLTTFIGFISMNLADLPPLRSMGNVIAIGVLISSIFTLIALPIYTLAFRKAITKPHLTKRTNPLIRLADFIIGHKVKIIVCASITSILLCFFAFQNRFYDPFPHYLAETNQFTIDTRYIDDNVLGLSTIEYSIQAQGTESIKSQAYFQTLSEITDWLRAQPEVRSVQSFSDTIKELHFYMNGGDIDSVLPNDDELIAQYILLYELNLPAGLGTDNIINNNQTATKLSVSFASGDPDLTKSINSKIMSYLMDTFEKTESESTGAGLASLFSEIGEISMEGSIKSSLFSLTLISILLMLVLKSLGMGILSTIPNIMPIAFGFGFWFFIDGDLGLPLTLVLGTMIGIVVDDTVHFLIKYLKFKAQGFSIEECVRKTIETVGPAIIVTSITIILAMCVLSVSEYKPNIDYGILSVIIIASALLIDLVVLPAALLIFDKNKTKIKIHA